MKTAKKKTAKAVKKGPAGGGAPLRLEVGKYYGTRADDLTVHILKTLDEPSKYSFMGKFVGPEPKHLSNVIGWETPYGAKGEYWGRNGRTDEWDLVREVPRPPRAK